GPGSLEIKIRTTEGRTLTVDVKPDRTIEELMEKLKEQTGVPPEQLRVIYNGRELEPRTTLEEYNITPGVTLELKTRSSGHGT
uniref:Hydra-1ubq n=1 Tax=Homo sapiens TaxID=9606 RepID=UPI00168D9BFA|nr:Chain A, Hydra-1ubq [Homo sapiens]